MRKILTGSLLLLSFLSQAQIDFRAAQFGVLGGATYSRVKNAHNPSGPRYSVLGGVTAQVPIGITEQFYLQAELMFFGAGEGGDREYEKAKGWDHAVYANNYLVMPLNFKVYFSEAESEFFGIIGPRFYYLLNQEVKNAPKISYEVANFGKANTFNFGLGTGIGYSLKRQLELVLKYDAGLSNVYPYLKNSPEELATSDANVRKKKSEQMLSVALTYFFR